VQSIDEALAAGESYGAIARRFGPSQQAVGRHHHAGHTVPVELATYRAGLSVLDRVEALFARADRIVTAMEARHAKSDTIIRGLGELRQQLTLLARITGDLRASGALTVNILATDEFRGHLRRVRRAIIEEVGPDAAVRIAQRLAASDDTMTALPPAAAAVADSYGLIGDADPGRTMRRVD
jgi:hypothetical protein